MLRTQRKGRVILHVRKDFLHFLQSGGGNHEIQLPSSALLRVEGAPGKPEPVHGYGGDGVIRYLKFHTGVNGTPLIFADSENGAGNQLLQLVLGNINFPSIAHVRQLRIILGGLGGNGKGSVPCPDGDFIVLVHHHGHRSLRQTADDIAEQLRREDALTHVGHVRVDFIGNGGFHIITGQAQSLSGLAEDSFDDGQTALLGDGTTRNVQSRDQHIFFTGKTHR